ncbi:MAG: HIRAN domain-containing protein [bacterium]
MIIPIHGLRYHTFKRPSIDDPIKLVKERNNLYDELAIAAYTINNEKIGYVSAKSCYNKKVFDRMQDEELSGLVWAVFQNEILIELDFQKNLPQKTKSLKKV